MSTVLQVLCFSAGLVHIVLDASRRVRCGSLSALGGTLAVLTRYNTPFAIEVTIHEKERLYRIISFIDYSKPFPLSKHVLMKAISSLDAVYENSPRNRLHVLLLIFYQNAMLLVIL